jgi:hypothetical protein
LLRSARNDGNGPTAPGRNPAFASRESGQDPAGLVDGSESLPQCLERIESAIVAARARIRALALSENNHAALIAALEAIVHLSDRAVDAFRQLAAHRVIANP